MKNKHNFKVRILALTALCAPLPAYSQAATTTEAPNDVEEVIVVGQAQRSLGFDEALQTATRLPVTAFNLPASVDRIDQAELVARGRTSVVDGVVGVTGVTAQVRAGAAGVYSWRGFTENGVAVLFDGIRVQASTITTRNLDAFTFEAIEVARGPGSGIHGEGALAGAVNYVRKSAKLADAASYEILTTLGSFDSARLGAGMNVPIGDQAAIRIDAVQARQGSQVAGFDTDTSQILVSARFEPSDRLAFTGAVDWFSADAEDAYWGTPVINGRPAFELAKVNYNNATNNIYKDEVLWLTLGAKAKPSDGLILEARAWRYQADRDWRNIGRFLWNPSTNTVGRTFWEDLGYDHSLTGGRATAAWTGTDRLALIGGVEVSRTDFSSPRQYSAPFGLQQQVDPLNPTPIDFFAFGRPRVQARETKVDQISAFSEARFEIGPRLSVQATVRYDSLDVDFVRFDQTPTRFYVAEYRDWSGTIGGTWNATPALNLYAQWGRSATPADSLLVISDPATAAFDLTKGEGYEIGFKARWLDGRIEATGALYWLKQSDIPGNDPANPSATIQIGKLESNGLEASLLIRPTRTLSFEANLAIVDAAYADFIEFGADRRGNRPPNVPDALANVFVDWRFAPGWSVGGALRSVSDIAANTSNSVVFPGYTLFDLDLRRTLSSGLDLALIVRNVGDEDAAVWATGAGGQASMANLGPGTNWQLSLRARF
jgi:iron complex outermembrane receptor protein